MQDCESFNLDMKVKEEYVEDRYEPVGDGYIGGGREGFVLEVLDKYKKEVYAMKISTDLDLNPIETACKLSELSKYTDCIISIIDWSITNGDIPHLTYYDRLEERDPDSLKYKQPDNPDLLIYTMPLAYATLTDRNLGISLEDYADIIFELVVTLIVLGNVRVSHGDLHAGNVVLIKNNIFRHYTLNNGSYLARCKYQPMLIDFSGHFDASNSEILHDWNKLFTYIYLPKAWYELEQLKVRNLSILYSSFFDRLRDKNIYGGDTVKYFEPVTFEMSSINTNTYTEYFEPQMFYHQ